MGQAPTTNITPVQAKTALQESEPVFRIMAEMTSSAIFIVRGNRILYLNPATECLTGYDHKELLDFNFYSIFPPKERKLVREAVRQLNSEEAQSVHLDTRIITKSGEGHWIDLTAATINFDGKSAWLGTAFDITELVNETRIRNRTEELEALYTTTRDITTQREIKPLLQAIIDRAANLLDAAGGSIYLCNKERDELEIVVTCGDQNIPAASVSPGEGLVGQVMQNLEPIVVDDYRVWEGRSSKFDLVNAAAALAVPMLYVGELVGVILVYEVDRKGSAPLRRYTRSEVDLIAFFANAAAGAIHNATLFDETRQRLVELELLYQASLSASQVHSQRAVAQRIVDTIEQLLNWNTSIWVNEEQKPVLMAHNAMSLSGLDLTAYGEKVSQAISSYEHGIIGWVCKHGQSVRSRDVRTHPLYIPFNEMMASTLCVPLRVGGKTIGCIEATSEQVDDFSEQDEQLLTTLANQASVAIENARLFEETRRMAVKQQALNSIITASTRSGADLDTILNAALDQTLQALTVDMGAIWLSPTKRGVQRRASKGVPPSIGFILTNAAIMGNISLKQTVVVNNWLREPHPFSETFEQLGLRAAIVVPLLSEGEHIGGLAIVSPQPRNWTTEEAAFVEAIGREVGAAAERARLFEETHLRLTELEAINRMSRALRSASSMGEMLPLLIDETLGALGTDTGSIWFVDPGRNTVRQVIGRGWCLQIANLDLEPNGGLPGMVISSGDIYFSPNLAADSRTSLALRNMIPTGWSGLCVPIRAELETIGVFLVSSQQPREFNTDDARLLVTLAEMAGASIHRMRLVEKTANYASQLEVRVTERTVELMGALEKAKEADRLKTEFIASINHELRTPLTNLILYYQMLRSQPTVKTEERLDVIGREMQRLRTLIEDLLNLSRLDLGQVEFNPGERDLNHIITALMEDRRSLAEERGLSVETELLSDLPPVPVDEPTIVQAISNLLTNAMNYTPPGGKITVKTFQMNQEGSSWVCFSVIDTGLGITKEEIPFLFERFYRGKAAHQSGSPGTGLGLPIVKEVVERHRGRIEIGSNPAGQGAVFTVWLPLNDHQETGRSAS
jgi:PAS domain S-box-containing protein